MRSNHACFASWMLIPREGQTGFSAVNFAGRLVASGACIELSTCRPCSCGPELCRFAPPAREPSARARIDRPEETQHPPWGHVHQTLDAAFVSIEPRLMLSFIPRGAGLGLLGGGLWPPGRGADAVPARSGQRPVPCASLAGETGAMSSVRGCGSLTALGLPGVPVST